MTWAEHFKTADDRELIARIIYDCWPNTYSYSQSTTAVGQDGRVIYERVVGTDTWEEVCEESPVRAAEIRVCADKIIEALARGSSGSAL